MRFAQAPPGAAPAAIPMLGEYGAPPGSEPGGMPPAGGALGAEGAAPAAPVFQIIHSPLSSLGMILADLDFKTYLENNFGTDPGVLANKIFILYGGSKNEIGPSKKGERFDHPASSDPTQLEAIQTEEYNNTRNARWKRLPMGVGIDEITTPEAIKNAITGGYNELSKQMSKPPTPASASSWIRIADTADRMGQFKIADQLDQLVKSATRA